MEGTEAVINSYNVSWLERTCILKCFSRCYPNRAKELRKQHFFKKWLQVHEACDPENIQWKNLGTRARERRCRVGFIWIVAICLILLSLLGIVYMKDITASI